MTDEHALPSEKKRRGRPRKNPVLSNVSPENTPQTLEQLTQTCIFSLHEALHQIETLVQERHRQKLSDQRIRNVGRELKELIKVMTRYGQI